MLSILIPVYNFDVCVLVNKLHQQAILTTTPFEIIVMEDASAPEFVAINTVLKTLSNVQYIVLEKNMGRSKIRNHLANLAQYDYLLFMDCDSMPIDDYYIQNYIDKLNPKQLLYGGRCYQSTAPKEQQLYFHWWYGKNREESTAQKRQEHPHHSFMTNNFLIPKAIFQAIKFDESITQYGHEDTLFGIELQKQRTPILHINNPLEHIGLEKNMIFIGKSQQAIQNLCTLYKNGYLKDEVKLLRFFVKTTPIHFIIRFVFVLTRPLIEHQLASKQPSLLLFDFYKLGYFTYWHKQAFK